MTTQLPTTPNEGNELYPLNDLLYSFRAKLWQDPVRDSQIRVVHQTATIKLDPPLADPLPTEYLFDLRQGLIGHINQCSTEDELRDIEVWLLQDKLDAKVVGAQFLEAFIEFFKAIGAKRKEMEMTAEYAQKVHAMQAQFGPDLSSVRERQQLPAYNRTEAGQRFIDELEATSSLDQGTAFDRELLNTLKAHPQMTIRQCWETVEERAVAQIKLVGSRKYPHSFEN